jgi:hypothetical protein
MTNPKYDEQNHRKKPRNELHPVEETLSGALVGGLNAAERSRVADSTRGGLKMTDNPDPSPTEVPIREPAEVPPSPPSENPADTPIEDPVRNPSEAPPEPPTEMPSAVRYR